MFTLLFCRWKCSRNLVVNKHEDKPVDQVDEHEPRLRSIGKPPTGRSGVKIRKKIILLADTDRLAASRERTCVRELFAFSLPLLLIFLVVVVFCVFFFFSQPYQGHCRRRCQTDDNYFFVDDVTLEFFRRRRAAYHASSIGHGNGREILNLV